MNFAFLLTFTIIALIPGANNILSTAIAMSFGYKKALIMNIGASFANLILVSVVALGLSSIMMKFPQIFIALRLFGLTYMLYIAYKLYQSSQMKSVKVENALKNKTLFFQGFINSIANIGLWLLMISFLPPYIGKHSDLILIVSAILLLEFLALNIYALFGAAIKQFLSEKISLLNKISALAITALAFWLFFDLIKALH